MGMRGRGRGLGLRTEMKSADLGFRLLCLICFCDTRCDSINPLISVPTCV